MRSVLRYLSPIIRSRRRISFLLTVIILLSISFILFIINQNRHPKVFIDKIIKIQQQEKSSSNTVTISILKASNLAEKYVISCMNNFLSNDNKYLFQKKHMASR
jgi:hypothetical protein